MVALTITISEISQTRSEDTYMEIYKCCLFNLFTFILPAGRFDPLGSCWARLHLESFAHKPQNPKCLSSVFTTVSIIAFMLQIIIVGYENYKNKE